MKNKSIIIFSSIDWYMHKQLHHQLTYSLLKNNNRILYIENSGVRRAGIKDLSRIVIRLKDWSKSIGGYKENIKNLTILVSLLFPFPYSKFFTFLNSLIINNKINKWLSITKISKPVIITFLPTPLIHKIVSKIDYEILIYYCANNMSKGSKNSLPLKYWENLMFSKCDSVISISDEITKRAIEFNANIKKISPGVDDIFFKKYNEKNLINEFININKPIVGYVGSISDVIDYDLIEFLVKKLTKISFVFVGPVYTKKINKLISKYKNIYFFGGKKHNLIPDYINTFDITIIPYLVNDFTHSVYSCKLNEYLACGKPVISTSIKENINFDNQNPNIISIANSYSDFEEKVIKSLNNDNDLQKLKRKEIARINSWSNRFNDFDSFLNNELIKKDNNKSMKDNFSFINIYKNSRLIFKRLAITLLLSIFILFYSPLFWFLGNNLNNYDNAENAEAIIVFSGNDSKYSDQNYLELVLEAKNLFDKKFAESLILISGRDQTIKEVEVMKLYLLSKGVPAKKINIFNNYPNSTFMGISMINELLNKKKISKVLYISSKYHNLRSNLIWHKNYPEKEIIYPKLNNNKNKLFFWTSSVSDILTISYELLSIAYNKLLGRI